MTAETLLSRLEKVKRTGQGRWQARCPAHDDRSPSLSICEKSDGRTLCRCFAGCSVEEILLSVGLDWAAIMPTKALGEHFPKERRPFLPADVFDIARQEIGVVTVIAADLLKQKSIRESDYQRVFKAVERLDSISRAAYGH